MKVVEVVNLIGRFIVTIVAMGLVAILAIADEAVGIEEIMFIAITYVSGNAVIKASANLGAKKAKR